MLILSPRYTQRIRVEGEGPADEQASIRMWRKLALSRYSNKARLRGAPLMKLAAPPVAKTRSPPWGTVRGVFVRSGEVED